MPKARHPDLRLASSQFPVSADLQRNGRYIVRHIARAADEGADAILFPEAALTGYPGADREHLRDLDRAELSDAVHLVQDVSAHHGICTLVGSAHYVGDRHRPTNCVYVIGSDGRIQTRYDKRMLYGSELEHYTAGSSAVTFMVRGVRCSVLICFDSWFQEHYAELEARRVRVLFHAFYNAGRPRSSRLDDIMGAQVLSRAFDHSYAIVASNSSRRHSHMSSRVVLPDGRGEAMPRHRPGVVVFRIPSDDSFWGYRCGDAPKVRAARRAYARAASHPRIRNRRATP